MKPPAPTPVAYPELGAIISRVQSRFIRAAPPAEVFDPLLTDLLECTGSAYGFIGEVLDDPGDGHRFLRILVLTDIAWDDATRAMFQRHRAGQPLEFHNPGTLFGAAIRSGTPVIANEPGVDPRRGGLPPGHPAMLNFLGVPLFHGGEMVGMVGLANRSGGYDAALVEFLQPLFASVAAIIGAVRLDQARREAERALRQREVALLAAQAAERANAAKTEFLSRMSHELRTPLNAVLGFAQLLQMDSASPLSAEQQAKLQHIERAGTHLLAMINDVLDLSRIDSGGMPLTAQTVWLQAAVQEAQALVASAARDAQVMLRIDAPSTAALHVRADPLRLRQVLVNLLSNAIKYNRPLGSVTVRWRATPDASAVQLQVADTGVGLSAEQQAHLFEPFNRLGAERSPVEGTGIGLVVTQRLVELMAGAITVSSQPGVGSTFTVTLPGGSGPAWERPRQPAP